ncbi:MAG: hypothetical protein HYR71_12440, partial [Chloroflexi bacterium]|nr:hypothetical protein [Chloroflexota bacterium]
PFVEVSDAQISAGQLMGGDGLPRYPIVISLATEAVDDAEVAPLRQYVAAGGFLFVGSSAFTRHPDGTTRGDFALAAEIGLQMVAPRLQNWYKNDVFTKVADHLLVAHFPPGDLHWRMPLHSEQMSLSVMHAEGSPRYGEAAQYTWQVRATGAEVLAMGRAGPLLTDRPSGNGHLIYYGAMQPLIGHGTSDPGMYAYVIFRQVIEWAFASARAPLVRLSPWRYPYDAALLIRHDLENSAPRIQGVEPSAQFEQSLGAKADYYFTTGTLRLGSEDQQISDAQKEEAIAGLRRAVSLYGATIGSHNGGLPNPITSTLAASAYDYWHWGPDQVLNLNKPGYAAGKTYAYTSILNSFQDIEQWLSGLDNGRAGCGAANNCPRIWAAPYYAATREDSYAILEKLGAITAGEQKDGPFPHWTLSTQTAGKHYTFLTLPLSDWVVGAEAVSALEYHNAPSMHAAVDFYARLGMLINIHGHNLASIGLMRDYITYALAKPRIWSTNAVGVYDWWRVRSNVAITPSYSKMKDTITAHVTVSGASDTETAIEITIPDWSPDKISAVHVFRDGVVVTSDDYRATRDGVKVKAGAGSARLEVRYAE